MSDFLDDDRYPTEEALEKIRVWPHTDLAGAFAFVRSIWWSADWGWHTEIGEKTEYKISTGGWSGNESLIAAMKANRMLWLITWQQSRRGGHYIFELPRS